MSIVHLPSGNYVEVLSVRHEYDPYAGNGYQLQLYSAGGDPIGDPLIEYSGHRGGLWEPQIIPLPDGGFAAAFYNGGYASMAFAHRVEGGGQQYSLGSVHNVTSVPQVTVTVLDDGGTVAVFATRATSELKQFDPDGEPVLAGPIAGYGVTVEPGEGDTYTLNWLTDAGPRSIFVDPQNPPDFTPPPRPDMVGIDDVPEHVGEFGNGSRINDPTPEIRLEAPEVGQTITLVWGSGGYTVTQADVERGYADISSLLSAGQNHLLITSANGLASTPFEFQYILDTTPIGRPAVSRVFDNVGDAQGRLDSGHTTDDATPQVQVDLRGATIGDTLALLVDGEAVLSTTVTAAHQTQGYVAFFPSLTPGAHSMTVMATDQAGNVSHSYQPFHIGVSPDPVTVGIDGPATVAEGDEGTASVTFTVSRTGLPVGVTQVDYFLWSAEASAEDFTGPTSGTVHFDVGDSSKTVTIQVTGDLAPEADEAFTVTLSNPRGGAIADGSAQVTIVDDDVVDPQPPAETVISLSGPEPTVEGDGGPTDIPFVVTRSGDTSSATLVDWFIWGSETSGDDFIGATAGTVEFAPGETTKTIHLSAAGDDLPEDDEQFHLMLSNARGGTIEDGDALATILDDDEAPAMVSVAGGGAKAEGTGDLTAFEFMLTRSGDSTSDALVDWFVWGDTDAADFSGATAGTVYFDAGETTATVLVQVNADDVPEADEQFHVVLSNARGAELGSSTTSAWVQNDDPFGLA